MSTPKAKRDKDEEGGSRGTTPKGAKEDPQEAATEVKAERAKKSAGNKDKEGGESTEKQSKSGKKGDHGESHADADKPSKGDKDEHLDDGAKKHKSKRKSKEYPATDSDEDDDKEPVVAKKAHHKKALSGSDSEHAVSSKHAASPPVKAATYPMEGSDKDNSKREHSASRSTSKKNIPSKDTDFEDTSTSSQVENETRSRHVDTVEDLLDADTSDEDSDEEDAKLFPRTSSSSLKKSGKKDGDAPAAKSPPSTSPKPDSDKKGNNNDKAHASGGKSKAAKHSSKTETPAPAADKPKPAPAQDDETSSESAPPLPDSDVEEAPKKEDKKPAPVEEKKKKPGIFASFFGKKKDSDKEKKDDKKGVHRPEHTERKTIWVSSLTDLSEDLQKKLKKAKIPEEKIQKNFRILLNVLHFLTKDSYKIPGEEKEPPRERRPYASPEMIEEAKKIVAVPDNIKKYYRSIEFSGKGGFGRVFAAKDVATKRRVAIKRVPHVTEKDKRNNYCEVAFLSQCKHPNIVNFIKAWEVKDEAWIVTEFLEGGTLSEAVKVHQFSERHIAYVAREILKALKYLHANNFVHRDLKSGNVMMSIEGHIKLIDFGLCCEIATGERVQMLGSPYWIPPEMIKRKPHGSPADIWSFAVCVLEMYLKEPPNAHSRLYAMFTAASDGILDAIPHRASSTARDFLSKCLVVNPAKRATAEELLQHPFVTQPKLEEGIKDVLRGVFVSNSLALSGI